MGPRRACWPCCARPNLAVPLSSSARAVPILSLGQARCLHLAAQGLLEAPRRQAKAADVRRAIQRMALLQIDSIQVVARSPYLVLYSRLVSYAPPWLDQALAKGQIAETWAHEACFVPVADWPKHLAYNRDARQHWGIARAKRHRTDNSADLNRLLAHVREHGPVKSSDFERSDDRTSAWWGWKDEKRWLEALFANGDLMVARREHFQRVYDLPERVAPHIGHTDLPPADAVHADFIEQSVKALGITQARWINDYFRIKPRLKDADLDDWVAQGRLRRVAVQGWDAPAYVHSSHLRLLGQALRNQLRASHTTVLSPFDPVVWDRERVQTLFDFEYRIECYTPEAKRQYGYFVLPLLHQGQLVGRVDAKARRSEGVFEIKSFHVQPGFTLGDHNAMAIARALVDLAAWHQTPHIQPGKGMPAALRALLKVRASLPSS